MQALLHRSAVALAALLYVASGAVVLGGLMTVYSQTIRIGLAVALTAFVLGMFGIAYGAKRSRALA
jgi:hypothetical protein